MVSSYLNNGLVTALDRDDLEELKFLLSGHLHREEDMLEAIQITLTLEDDFQVAEVVWSFLKIEEFDMQEAYLLTSKDWEAGNVLFMAVHLGAVKCADFVVGLPGSDWTKEGGLSCKSTLPNAVMAKRNRVPLLEALLEHDHIDVNYQGQPGGIEMPPLHTAIDNDCIEVVEYLLSREDVDVNLWDRSGDTPLHVAGQIDNFEAAKLLLAHPAVDAHKGHAQGGHDWTECMNYLFDCWELTLKPREASGQHAQPRNSKESFPRHIFESYVDDDGTYVFTGFTANYPLP